MIKTIIFDLGGVLLDLDMDQCFYNIRSLGIDTDQLNKIGADKEASAGATLCDGITATGIINLYQVGKVTTDQFIGTLQSLSSPGTTYQQALEAWNSCLLTIPPYKLDYILDLREEGYRVCLLSNTNDAHWKHIDSVCFPEEAEKYFDNIFLSHEMHLAKPNADIYLEMLRQLNVQPEECLFIDDAKVNCDAAGALGIKTFNTPVRYDFRKDVNALKKEQK